jgi:hypothetical protein
MAPPVVFRALHSAGHPLEPSVRRDMEGRFGEDFRAVRVHTDSVAAESASAVHAAAYSVGSDVVFGAAQYAPQTPTGRS